MLTFNMTTASSDLPPLPAYTAEPLPPLVPGFPDKYFTLILMIFVYWGFSMLFHVIDEMDWFPQYRLHTPVEVSNRNHVSRWECFRDVIIQQVVQTVVGALFTMQDPDQLTGMDEYNIAVWAQRIRLSERYMPSILSFMGIDGARLATNISKTSPILAGALSGGHYATVIPTFVPWELRTAFILYNFLIPAFQFAFAVFILDTWQYFLHRAMHTNKWLYTTFHSRHHRLYVPYAYGALYNHPFEGFLLDTCGGGIAFLASGLTVRQSMWFFAISTMKTVDDHCGYAFPWDPLQHISGNNAGYHDVHHQSWGIKTNFSQPYFTFWDWVLGTMWIGGDVSARYERSRVAAEKKEAQRQAAITNSLPQDSQDVPDNGVYDDTNATVLNSEAIQPQVPAGKATAQAADSRRQVVSESGSAGGPSVIAEETAEEQREREINCLPGVIRRTSGSSAREGGMMGLFDRVHKRKGSLL